MNQSFLCVPYIPVGYAGGRQKTAPAFSAFVTSLWFSNVWSSCRDTKFYFFVANKLLLRA